MTYHVATGPEAYDVLLDPAFVPPPATPGRPGGIDWLRSSVARFSSGTTHERRRELAVRLLMSMDLDWLRERAREHAAVLAGDVSAGDVSAIAREVPVRTLAEALGLTEIDVTAVRTVAAAYLSGGTGPEADLAVARLVAAFGGVADEQTAARIGLLAQACEATAGLVRNTLAVLADHADVGSAIEATLQSDPPVRSTARQATTATEVNGRPVSRGDSVRVDLTRGLPFSAGAHTCPGHAQAIAIAAGICDAVRP